MVRVSIIIPTYKDWNRLNFCIRALCNQSFPLESFETIVVNNAPGDTIPASFVLPIDLKIIPEKSPGSYAARNAGLKIAKGEIIGFTDSDCIPDENWIAHAVDFFDKNPGISRVTGPVKIFYKKSRPSAVELYDSVYAFPQQEYAKNGWAVTANLFVRREIFSVVGNFNAGTMSGGDLEWGIRAQEKNFAIKFNENVVINHPARDTFSSLFEKAKRVGIGKVILENPRKEETLTLLDYLAVFKPKSGEVKRILIQEKGLNIFNRMYLLFLRHIILWTSELSKLYHVRRNKNQILISK